MQILSEVAGAGACQQERVVEGAQRTRRLFPAGGAQTLPPDAGLNLNFHPDTHHCRGDWA